MFSLKVFCLIISLNGLYSANSADETPFADQIFNCYKDYACSLNLVRTAFTKNSLSKYDSNFRVQGENPGKIYSWLFNGNDQWGHDFMKPMVVKCMDDTVAHLNTYNQTYHYMEYMIGCVRNSFESKVNETGWQYIVGLGHDYGTYLVRADYNYRAEFNFQTISLYMYL